MSTPFEETIKQLKDTPVFMTGGSGFVGRRMIKTLVAHGVEVRALARSADSIAVVKGLGAQPVKGDLNDQQALRDGMKGCKYVFHLAAATKVWGNYQSIYDDTVTGTINVVEAARASGVKRFIHCGTEAVLVGHKIHNANEELPIPDHPEYFPYSKTKGLAEKAVLGANGQDIETISIRPRLIWGSDDTVVLPIMINMVKSKQWIWMSGGHYLASHIHVQNACEGLILGATNGRPGQAYFVSDGKPTEFRAFFSRLFELYGVPTDAPPVPFTLLYGVAFCMEMAWGFASYFCNIKNPPPLTRQALRLVGEEVTVDDTKARKELGYRGMFTLEEGLREIQDEINASSK